MFRSKIKQAKTKINQKKKTNNNNKTNKQTGNFSFIIHFLFNTSIFLHLILITEKYV